MARIRHSLAVLLLLVPALAGAADELGTLFHTTEERARLDRLRRGDPPEPAAGARAAARDITGYVQRSDGKHTLWIDGVPVPVVTPKSTPLIDPRAVRPNASTDEVKVERKAPK